MPERLVRQSAILCASLVLAACGQVIAPEGPAGDPGAIGFQDCEPPFVLDGDSTIAALGIDGPAPFALIALIAVLLVAGVISWPAFGRERSSAS